MYCNVLVTKPFDQSFTYKAKKGQKIQLGSVVKVSFANKKDQLGIISEILGSDLVNKKSFRIKEIDYVYKDICLNKEIIKFINWIADYTVSPIGLVLKLFLINEDIINFKNNFEEELNLNLNSVSLNADQIKAFNIIKKNLFNNTAPIVLEGVTGSGKTEVYFEAIEKIILEKKQCLIMLPEISLTPQLEIRFKERFGFSPDIWHSKISNKKRKIIWHKCYQGYPIIVLGARSSLFLPFKNLGIIVVDEEHDISFKQEENVRYQARDLAIVRSKIEKCSIILSSATPSIETQNNIIKNKFLHVFLPNQFSGLDLPEINLIDLRKENLSNNQWISPIILKNVKECIDNGEQALLFLNRRGYSPLCVCSNCGYRFQCNHCSSWLVMHKNKKRLLCHHCGTIYPIEKNCVKCNSINFLKFIGPGVERVAEEIKNFFPKYKIGVMSSDNANTPLKIKNIIDNFSQKKIEILVATQIMAKGYHFPNLSFVGVIDADAGLLGADLKANERTYNLLEQVSGRAGRSNKKGKVFIQTYFPNQPIMQSLKIRNRKEFIEQCLNERKTFNTPPFSFLTAIIISGHSRFKAETYSKSLAKSIIPEKTISVLGPVEAPLFLLRGKYRYRILLKGKSRRSLNNFTRKMIKNCPSPSNLRIVIDVDPYTFL